MSVGRGHTTSCVKVINPNTLEFEWMTQPGGSTGGGTGDASAANQTTEIAKLTSIDTKLSGPIPVNDNGGSLTVDGTVGVSGTVTVTGTVTANAGTGPFPVSDNAGSLTVDAPVATPVFVRLSDGAAAISALPVTDNNGSLTVDGSVSVSNFPATQPVSGTITANAGTGTFAVSGTVTANVGTGTQPVSGTVAVSNFPATQPVSGTVTVQHGLTGATNVFKTGTITTTATTADQVVLTYTVTSGKTFYLQYLVMYGRLTVLAATATILGAISLETPSGTKCITFDDVNPTTSELEFNPLGFSEPIPIAAGTVVRVVVTPAAATSMLWRANFGGYEK
jgi:hypothetical protein